MRAAPDRIQLVGAGDAEGRTARPRCSATIRPAALSKGPVTHNTFQSKLDELQLQLSTVQQFSIEDPGQLRELLPVVLAGLQKSLAELRPDSPREPEASLARNEDHDQDPRLARARRFRVMAEWSPVLVRIMGVDSRCRWANHSWSEFTGSSRSELLGEGWLERVHPADRERCREICREALESNRLYRMEYRLERSSGGHGWILEVGTPRFISGGGSGGHLGVAAEITAHKQAEMHLTVQYAVARILAEAQTLDEAGSPILRSLCETLGWELGELWTLDGNGSVPRLAQLWADPELDASELRKGMGKREIPSSRGAPWQSGAPAWIADIALDEALAGEPEARLTGLHTMFRLPIKVRGEIQGIVRIFARSVRQADAALIDFLISVGLQIGQFLERQRGIEATRTSEARKAAMLDASLEAVITVDPHGRVVEFNSAAEAAFGYRREEAIGHELSGLVVPPRMRERALEGFAHCQESRHGDLLGKRYDTLAMRSNGAEFPVEVAIAPIGTGEQPLFTIFVRDNTMQVRAEAVVRQYQDRLRSLMADLLLAEERERRRLAVDLHDGLSQTIALTQMKVSALRSAAGVKIERSLEEIAQLIDQTNRTARSIGFELSPPVLHDLGLVPALQWLVENIRARYEVSIELVYENQFGPTDERCRVILFRSIRELLINAAKHAGATHVRVRLHTEASELLVAVEDDGVGMEQASVPERGSGLFSIQERVSHVGGSMQIDSARGQGTKVQLRVPLVGTLEHKIGVRT